MIQRKIRWGFIVSFMISTALYPSTLDKREEIVCKAVTTWPLEHTSLIHYLKALSRDGTASQAPHAIPLDDTGNACAQLYTTTAHNNQKVDIFVITMTKGLSSKTFFRIGNEYLSAGEVRTKTQALAAGTPLPSSQEVTLEELRKFAEEHLSPSPTAEVDAQTEQHEDASFAGTETIETPDAGAQAKPITHDAQTQTPKRTMRTISTQTGEGPCPEPEGFFEQLRPKHYAWPPNTWKLPDNYYWFPAVVSISLLQGDVIDMSWLTDLLVKMKLPQLRDYIRKYISPSILENRRKGSAATAAFALVTTALAYYATQKYYQDRLPFFEWNVEQGKYFPNFNRMIVWGCVLYGATEAGKQLFLTTDSPEEES